MARTGRLGARPPRVHVTYDVDIDGARTSRELPFVLGVIGDFAGNPDEPPPRLRERKFVDVDRENFDAVMKAMRSRLTLAVDNKLAGGDTKLRVDLRFNALEDFEPEQVARQVEPLRKLVEIRERLGALRATIRRRSQLAHGLSEVVSATDVGSGKPPGGEAEAERPAGAGSSVKL